MKCRGDDNGVNIIPLFDSSTFRGFGVWTFWFYSFKDKWIFIRTSSYIHSGAREAHVWSAYWDYRWGAEFLVNQTTLVLLGIPLRLFVGIGWILKIWILIKSRTGARRPEGTESGHRCLLRKEHNWAVEISRRPLHETDIPIAALSATAFSYFPHYSFLFSPFHVGHFSPLSIKR